MRTTLLSVAIATALATTACHTMRPVSLDDLVVKPTARVWVTRQDQSVVVVDGPQVFRGKLVGFVDGRYREIPPTDLQQLVARRPALGKTLALIGASAASFTLAVVLLSGSGDDHDPCVGGPVDCNELMPQ